LFRHPKDASACRVFDPRRDGRLFADGVYTCEQFTPRLGEQKPFQFLLLHPLVQFLCVDLCRRTNGTPSIAPEYVFNSVSAAHGGILVRLSSSFFHYDDPIKKSSELVGDLSVHFSSQLTSQELTAQAQAKNQAPKRGRPRLNSNRSYDIDDQLKLRDVAISTQVKVKSQELLQTFALCSSSSESEKTNYLSIDPSKFKNPSTGRRIATNLVGLCMYELNKVSHDAFASCSVSCIDTETQTQSTDTQTQSISLSISSLLTYMHVTLILADPLAKSSGVLAFVLCIRLARRLRIHVVLEAVDRRMFKAGRDDLIGLYTSKFGFSEMSKEQVSHFCQKPEKGVVFMMLPPFHPKVDSIIEYEKYLLSLISPEELENLESESLRSLPLAFSPSSLVSHNESDNAPCLSKDQVGRFEFLHNKYPSVSELLQRCGTFSRTTKIPLSTSTSTLPVSPGLDSFSLASTFQPIPIEVQSRQSLSSHASQLFSIQKEGELVKALEIARREREQELIRKQKLQQDLEQNVYRIQKIEQEQKLKEEELIQKQIALKKAEIEIQQKEQEAVHALKQKNEALLLAKKLEEENLALIEKIKSLSASSVHVPLHEKKRKRDESETESDVLILSAKYVSSYLHSVHLELFNLIQLYGQTIQEGLWQGKLIRTTFKGTYVHGVTELNVEKCQGFRGNIERKGNEFVLCGTTTRDTMFGKTSFKFVFDSKAQFVKGFELDIKEKEVGWVKL
jgi:hypothetical protein